MIYVDPLVKCVPKGKWRWTEGCHMYADTIEELHKFADRLGMRREWFQDKILKHYDLNAQRRARAICLGATPVDRAFTGRRVHQARMAVVVEGEL